MISSRPTLLSMIPTTLILLFLTLLLSKGRSGSNKTLIGIRTGFLSGTVLGIFLSGVCVIVYDLPWFVPYKLLATLLMGNSALAYVLNFDFFTIFVGVLVLLALTGTTGAIFTWILRTENSFQILLAGILYGLSVWSILQYSLLPVFTLFWEEIGFPPSWFALGFGIYGLTLGSRLIPDTTQAPMMKLEKLY